MSSKQSIQLGNEILWTLEELAQKLQLKPDTVRKLCQKGKGPAYIKLGGRLYFRNSSIESWILSLETKTGLIPHVG